MTTTKSRPQATGPNQRLRDQLNASASLPRLPPPIPNAPPDEAPALPLLLRIKDVMRELAVSRRTVYELVKDGKLHLVRVGIRGSRIRTEEVLKLVGTNFKPLRIPRLRNQIEDESAAESP